ncbi:hypothetical protein Fmac_017340 [Flemingia macrophylla]|uniref:Uncharacterized protein n=1 Tax=Flemingia macrophylla TaxID=520843 RepID=A0ABD1M1U5_9FABA
MPPPPPPPTQARLTSRPPPTPAPATPSLTPGDLFSPPSTPAAPFLKRPPPARHHFIFCFTLCIWVSATPFPAKQREETMEPPMRQHSQRKFGLPVAFDSALIFWIHSELGELEGRISVKWMKTFKTDCTTVSLPFFPSSFIFPCFVHLNYVVAMILFRLAHSLSTKTLVAHYSLNLYLMSKIINMVRCLLATKLYPEFIKISVDRRHLLETTQVFEELTSLPNMCGAIDTTLVHLHSNPSNNPNTYCCHYRFPSLLLQLISNHKNIF